MTTIALISQGNTGGANISPFKSVELNSENISINQKGKAAD